jgi:hypothetical protein
MEQQGPTASTGVGKLIGLFGATACLQSVSTQSEIWLRWRAASGTCSCGARRRDLGKELLISCPSDT